MPYGDKEKQQLYQKLYYEKFVKKPTIKKGGNLKIDLMNYKSKPLEDVINPTLNHIPIPLKFEYDRYKDFIDTETKIDINGKVIDILDDEGNLKTNRQLRKEIIPKKNKTIKRLSSSLYGNEEIDNNYDIRHMTDADIKMKINDISKSLKDADIDEIIINSNEMFGDHKSRPKLEYAYK